MKYKFISMGVLLSSALSFHSFAGCLQPELSSEMSVEDSADFNRLVKEFKTLFPVSSILKILNEEIKKEFSDLLFTSLLDRVEDSDVFAKNADGKNRFQAIKMGMITFHFDFDKTDEDIRSQFTSHEIQIYSLLKKQVDALKSDVYPVMSSAFDEFYDFMAPFFVSQMLAHGIKELPRDMGKFVELNDKIIDVESELKIKSHPTYKSLEKLTNEFEIKKNKLFKLLEFVSERGFNNVDESQVRSSI